LIISFLNFQLRQIFSNYKKFVNVLEGQQKYKNDLTNFLIKQKYLYNSKKKKILKKNFIFKFGHHWFLCISFSFLFLVLVFFFFFVNGIFMIGKH